MPELNTLYLTKLRNRIQARLTRNGLNCETRRRYRRCVRYIGAVLPHIAVNEGSVSVDEKCFDEIQSVVWSLAVTESIDRDLSHVTPGAFSWAN